ncbi:MAG: hypothetical protein HRU19_27620 [Pseudobacteriovorax sp.]|nr:hypothetical protein [Pseudobacteriovorax sp.]
MSKAFILLGFLAFFFSCKTSTEDSTVSSSLSSSGGFIQGLANHDCNNPLTEFTFTDSQAFDPATGYSLLWVSRYSENNPRKPTSGPASIEDTKAVYREFGFVNPEIIPSPKDNMRAVVLEAPAVGSSSPKIIVTFRHSINNQNWLQNGLFLLQYKNDRPYHLGEKMHMGFSNSMNSMWSGLLATVKAKKAKNPNAQVIVVGHSLGAAFAAMSTVGFLKESVPVKYTYVTGAPRVGSISWVEKAQALLKANGTSYFRVSAEFDIIAHMPNDGRINFVVNLKEATKEVIDTYFKGFGDFLRNATKIFNRNKEQTNPPAAEDVKQLASVTVSTDPNKKNEYGILGEVQSFSFATGRFTAYADGFAYDTGFWERYFTEFNEVYRRDGLQKATEWVTANFSYHNVFGTPVSYSCSYYKAIKG